MKERYEQFYRYQLDELVVVLADFTCERCGRRAHISYWRWRDGGGYSKPQFMDDVKLCAHHRDGNPENNRRANLICLCRKCHLSAERLNRKFKQVSLLRWISANMEKELCVDAKGGKT